MSVCGTVCDSADNVCVCTRVHESIHFVLYVLSLSDPHLYGTVSSLFPKVQYPVLHYVNRHYPITFKELFTVLAEDHQELTHIGKKRNKRVF